MLLHYDFPGQGSVHGFEFRDQMLELPDDRTDIRDDLLANPHWRFPTQEEEQEYAARRAPEPENDQSAPSEHPRRSPGRPRKGAS